MRKALRQLFSIGSLSFANRLVGDTIDIAKDHQGQIKYHAYVDKIIHCISIPNSNTYTILELKEKQIKKDLVKNEARVKAFLSQIRMGPK